VTVRYYEQVGLLPVPSRTVGNYRSYSDEHVRRLRFIRRCRDLGFTLDQIRDLLRFSDRLAEELRRLNNCCQGKGIIADCRIIEALSPREANC